LFKIPYEVFVNKIICFKILLFPTPLYKQWRGRGRIQDFLSSENLKLRDLKDHYIAFPTCVYLEAKEQPQQGTKRNVKEDPNRGEP
jgi:hypothetical protein